MTNFGSFRGFVKKVSIHTPTQGVTFYVVGNGYKPVCFNPHTHAGCDYDTDRLFEVKLYVSIHTPTQGVTISGVLEVLLKKFQSTHPRRV